MLTIRKGTSFLGIWLAIYFFSTAGFGRSIYLNGIDISSARHQEMDHVNLRIDGEGNLFIVAPHYQVNEENTYVPLSSGKHLPGVPQSKEPGPVAMSPDMALPGRLAPATPPPASSPPTKADAEPPKEGSKTKDGGGEQPAEDKQ